MKLNRTELENGLTIITERRKGWPSVSVAAGVDYGSIDEPEELAGMAHYMEHMLFKGTGSRGWKEIGEEIEHIGGYMNAFTTRETTGYFAKVPKGYEEKALDVLSDMLKDPRFEEEEFEMERGPILSEILERLDDPKVIAYDLFPSTIFEGHPVSRPVAGTAETVGRIGRDDVVRAWEENYTTANTVIVAVGDVSHRDFVKLVKEYFEGYREGKKRTRSPVSVESPPKEIIIEREGATQTWLALGFRTKPFANDRADYALDVLVNILSSRLFEEVREKRGLSYSPFATHANGRTHGYMVCGAGVSAEDYEEADGIIAAELEKLRKGEFSDEEVEGTKTYMVNSFLMKGEDTAEGAIDVLNNYLASGSLDTMESYADNVSDVTPEDVRAAASSYIGAKKMGKLVLKPKEEARK